MGKGGLKRRRGRDAGRDQFLGLPEHPVAAFQLDRVRAGFLQEPDPGREGRLG